MTENVEGFNPSSYGFSKKVNPETDKPGPEILDNSAFEGVKKPVIDDSHEGPQIISGESLKQTEIKSQEYERENGKPRKDGLELPPPFAIKPEEKKKGWFKRIFGRGN